MLLLLAPFCLLAVFKTWAAYRAAGGDGHTLWQSPHIFPVLLAPFCILCLILFAEFCPIPGRGSLQVFLYFVTLIFALVVALHDGRETLTDGFARDQAVERFNKARAYVDSRVSALENRLGVELQTNQTKLIANSERKRKLEARLKILNRRLEDSESQATRWENEKKNVNGLLRELAQSSATTSANLQRLQDKLRRIQSLLYSRMVFPRETEKLTALVISEMDTIDDLERGAKVTKLELVIDNTEPSSLQLLRWAYHHVDTKPAEVFVASLGLEVLFICLSMIFSALLHFELHALQPATKHKPSPQGLGFAFWRSVYGGITKPGTPIRASI